MQGNKLYSILQFMNKYEQNRCRKYIRSPYFNANEHLSQLFDLLIDNINAKQPEELTKEGIWNTLYSDKDYDDVRLRKLFSDLLKLVEGFLAQEVYEENPLHQATYLIDAVGQKKMTKLYNSTMKTARRLSARQVHRPASHYFYQYEIERNFYELNQFERNRNEVTNIELIAQNLDIFYLAEKLRYYCAVLSRQYEVSHEYKILFIDEILQHLQSFDYEDYPPVSVYYQICLSIVESETEEHYFKLKSLLQKFGLEFPLDEASQIYIYALNYCTRKINKGNQNFLREYFELYNDLLEKQIIIIDGELAPAHFQNLVVVGLRLGEINWTEEFIQQYKMYLPQAQRENAVTFNLARLYFYKKDYDKVIELLQFVEYEELSYNLNSKTLLMQTYYEKDELEPLFSLLESFRVYLNRHNNIPSRRRKSYLNLIRFVRKIARTMPGDEKAIKKIKEELKSTKGVPSGRWLHEKISEIEGVPN